MESLLSNTLDPAPMRRGLILYTMTPMSFATRLRESREATRLTQRQLAAACGISDKVISALETATDDEGPRGMLAENLFAVADVLGVDARWLATGKPERGAPTTALAEITRGLEGLPVEQQEAVRSLVKSLTK